jgi:hypothetical protein
VAVVNRTIRLPDNTPPVTTLYLSGPTDINGAFIGYVTCNLTARDNESGLGVKSTQYYLQGDGWLPYSGPFNITRPGTVTLYYQSTDNAGNPERALSTAITVVAPQDGVTPSPWPSTVPTQEPSASPVVTAAPLCYGQPDADSDTGGRF